MQTTTKESSQARAHWTLQDVFWLTAALAIVLAYARSIGDSAIQQAIAYTIAVILLGGSCGLLGSVMKRGQNPTYLLKESLFWGGLVSLLFFVAVAGGRLPSPAIAIGWGVAAAVCGGLSGIRIPNSILFGTILCGILAGVSMIATVWAHGETLTWLIQFDVICAIGIGILIPPFVHFFQWLETQIHHPRVLLASWLTLAFVVGNALVPVLAGVSR